MGHTRQQKRVDRAQQSFDSDDGIVFVRCRICGDYRQVISGRHLSKHGIDRETYMKEYRLSPDELVAKDFRIGQSSRRDYYPYGKSDWIGRIKEIYETDGNIFSGYLQDKYPLLYDLGVWLFGDWDKALRAAGFDPEKMRMRTFWNQKSVIQEIRRMRERNLPLYARYVMNNHQKAFSAGLSQFGSWSKALLAAGISKKQVSGVLRMNRLAFLRCLRDALERHSGEDIPQRVRLHATHYFGSWRKAMIALKTDQRLLRGWSKQKIITAISQIHRSEESLAYAKSKCDHPTLVGAGEVYFGSWGKALHAAGIDPNLYFVHHKWRKPKVIDKR